ncbi:hypothetical protein GGF50DRAFT_85114 [Schizophyllum commune]
MPPVDLCIPTPDQRTPYRSSDAVKRARMEALSYRSNSRNLESPWYGLNNQLLTELSNGVLVTTPQFCLHEKRDIAIVEPNADAQRADAYDNDEEAPSDEEGGFYGPEDEVGDERSGAQGGDEEDGAHEVDVGDEGDPHEELGSDDEEDAHSARVSVPDSMMSDSSKNAVAGFPDFVWTHSIIIDLPNQPDRIPALQEGNKLTASERRRRAAQPSDESPEDRRARRYAQSFYLYEGKYLVHQAVVLIEEDKHHPDRRRHWTPEPNFADDNIRLQLQAAEVDICMYLFLYFFLVNPRAKVVVVRSTAGVFWRWTYFHRDQIPLHVVKDTRGAGSLTVREAGEDERKLRRYREIWRGQQVYVVGTQESDTGLTQMRDKVYETIKNESPTSHTHGRPVWGDAE